IDNDPTAPGAVAASDGAEPVVEKSDYVANEGKHLLLGPDDRWVRFPLRVDLVGKGDDIPALAVRRVGEFFAGLGGEPEAAAVAERFAGTVVIDANDIGRNILGHDTAASDTDLAAAFADNPLGQGRQQTPLAVVFDRS